MRQLCDPIKLSHIYSSWPLYNAMYNVGDHAFYGDAFGQSQLLLANSDGSKGFYEVGAGQDGRGRACVRQATYADVTSDAHAATPIDWTRKAKKVPARAQVSGVFSINCFFNSLLDYPSCEPASFGQMVQAMANFYDRVTGDGVAVFSMYTGSFIDTHKNEQVEISQPLPGPLLRQLVTELATRDPLIVVDRVLKRLGTNNSLNFTTVNTVGKKDEFGNRVFRAAFKGMRIVGYDGYIPIEIEVPFAATLWDPSAYVDAAAEAGWGAIEFYQVKATAGHFPQFELVPADPSSKRATHFLLRVQPRV